MTDHAADCGSTTRGPTGSMQTAFQDAGLGEPPDDPGGAAARVQASRRAVRWWPRWTTGRSVPPTRPGGLGSASGARADPDAWRDRVRDPAAWRDGEGPGRVGADGARRGAARLLLLALGERLSSTGGDGIGLSPARPGTVSRMTSGQLYPGPVPATARGGGQGAIRQPAAAYYQKALDIRPKAVAVYNDLGVVLIDMGLDVGRTATAAGAPGRITILHRAVSNDPGSPRA